MAKREQGKKGEDAFNPDESAERQPDEEETVVETGARYQPPEEVTVDKATETEETAPQDNVVSITPESIKPEIEAELELRKKDFKELFRLVKKYKGKKPELWRLKANNPKYLGPLLESIEQTVEPGLESVGESKSDKLLESVIELAHQSDSPYDFVKRLYDTSRNPSSDEAKFFKAFIKGIEVQASTEAQSAAA